MLTQNIDQLRRVVVEHIAQDAIVQGIYWDKKTTRGCFIGCLAHGNKPELNEEQYGLPVMLQRIAENIFEALSADEAKEFFAAFPDALGCDGKDLTKVGWQFLAAELRALPQQKRDIQESIASVIAGVDRLAAGQEWREVTAAWHAAWAVAWDAADAPWDGEAAAWAATWAAGAANANADVNAAAKAAANAVDDAARSAAAGAAGAAGAAEAADAAANAARRRQRDLLLRLITEAPIINS